MKQCSKCGEHKFLSEFHVDNGKPDFLRVWCKECSSIIQKKYRGTAKHKEMRKKWLEDHVEETKAYQEEYRAKQDKSWVRARARKYREKYKREKETRERITDRILVMKGELIN